MKVCHLTSVHIPFDTRIFHRECKTLARAGYDVTLIAPHDKKEIINQVKFIPLPTARNRLERAVKVSWKLFRSALKEKADIYHFHDPELIPVCLLLKLLTRSRIIYDVHENYPMFILTKEWIPSYLRFIISRLFGYFEQISFPFFDVIIVAGKDISEFFPHSEKVIVLRNFPLIELATRVTLKKEDMKSNQIVLIYAGMLSEDRGIKQMVEAIHYIEDDIKLVLIGKFVYTDFEEEVKEIADKRVEFAGHVPYEKVFEYLKNADIGLILFHPTPNNIAAASGRNNKTFEYMSAGLPIIAPDIPGWKELIEGGEYGIVVNPLDPEDIAAGIRKLIDNPELRISIGFRNEESFLKEFNWDIEKEVLLKLYRNLESKARK